jgi:hypothetical protein
VDITILEFKKDFTKTKMGNVHIRYGDLVLRCELVYNVKDNKAWIRMPEVWRSETYKHKYAYWLSKETSDEFQVKALRLLFQNQDLSMEKLAEVHMKKTSKYKKNKNV